MWHWLNEPIIVQCSSDGYSFSSKNGAVIWESWTNSGKLFHHSGNDGWWPLLRPLSHPYWIHSYRFHYVVLGCHNTHWIWLALLVWKSYICLFLLWGFVSSGRIHVFPVGSLVASRGKSNQHWSPQMPWLPLPWDQLDVLGSDWIGLDLFNDDTRPSGHISRPTQVIVSQNCFHSLNNYSSPIILSSLGASWS